MHPLRRSLLEQHNWHLSTMKTLIASLAEKFRNSNKIMYLVSYSTQIYIKIQVSRLIKCNIFCLYRQNLHRFHMYVFLNNPTGAFMPTKKKNKPTKKPHKNKPTKPKQTNKKPQTKPHKTTTTKELKAGFATTVNLCIYVRWDKIKNLWSDKKKYIQHFKILHLQLFTTIL